MRRTVIPPETHVDREAVAPRQATAVVLGRPDLLVLQATVAEPDGTTGHLALAMPAGPFGTQPWQLFAVLTYLAQLHQAGQDPTAASLRDHLAQRAPVPLPHWHYPYLPLHDPRVTTLLDVALGPRDTTGWPGVSVTVLEQERDGCSPFSRIRSYRDIRALAAHTALELSCERDHLAALAHRAADPGLRDLADLADRLADHCKQIEQAARTDRQRASAGRTRAALRALSPVDVAVTRFAPPPSARAELPEETGRTRTLTGTLSRALELRTVEGLPVARLQVTLDHPVDVQGTVRMVVCTLNGQAARNAAATHLAVGTRVIVTGTLTRHHYTRPGGIPHTAVSLDTHALGPDLAYNPPHHAAPGQ